MHYIVLLGWPDSTAYIACECECYLWRWPHDTAKLHVQFAVGELKVVTFLVFAAPRSKVKVCSSTS